MRDAERRPRSHSVAIGGLPGSRGDAGGDQARRGRRGHVTTYKIGDAVKRLNDVKMGDQVVLRVTDAPAILVEKP